MFGQIINESDIDSLELPEDNVKEYTKNSKHYVDNQKLSDELSAWSRANKIAKAKGEEPPRINNYIGECIRLIAVNYGKKPNFSGYSYLDEMIGDAIENVLRYLGNFNPDAETRSGTPNAYGYISLITHHAFTRRIEFEHRQAYYKCKAFELQGGMDMFAGEDASELREMGIEDANVIQSDMLTKVYVYEEKMKAKKILLDEEVDKKVVSKSNLLEFIELGE